ncbi:MAG: hypothetical protein ACXWZE_03935 [Candidatus Binatia bacterium]
MNKHVIRAAISAERLAETGPVVSGSWARQHDELGREIRGEFLIDTGAYGAMIDLAVAEMLPLTPLGTRAAWHPWLWHSTTLHRPRLSAGGGWGR